MAKEQTLVILKPDAVARNKEGLVSKIVARIKDEGLTLVAWRASITPTQKNLDEHFPSSKQWITDMGARARKRIKDDYKEDPTKYFFGIQTDHETGVHLIQGCRRYYLSGPLCVGVFEGENAVLRTRELIGHTMPSRARKGTIRGDCGVKEDREELRNGAARNLIHASDSVEEAKREIAVWIEWFNEEDRTYLNS